jgi:translation elongation factor EF-Tu-like GTPase
VHGDIERAFGAAKHPRTSSSATYSPTVSDVDFAIERCLRIPGRGTVLVGTIVAGTITVGNIYEFRGVQARCDGIEVGR